LKRRGRNLQELFPLFSMPAGYKASAGWRTN
jgi:hypothetical protein